MAAKDKGRILLAMTGYNPRPWYDLLSKERTVVTQSDGPADPTIHYAVAWKQKPNLLSNLPNLRAIFSVGAGVDHILSDPTLPDVPIVRVVADNLTKQMTDYVLWRVLDHYRRGLTYRAQQKRKVWREAPPAGDITVGIMGFGELGRAAAKVLMACGFTTRGWSRSKQSFDGVETYHGEEGLKPFLNGTDILVVLLPLTQQTTGIVNYRLLRQLRRNNGLGGAVLINAGRGRLQKDADILRALDDETLVEASLDVFEVEPLPRTSPLWNNPRVFVTPHAAAMSDPTHLVPLMLDQMDALERGKPLKNLVDRKAGY